MAQGGRRKLTSTEADYIGPACMHYGQLAAGLLLWLIGIPIILLVWLFGGLH